ncbi:hypothetical protein [Christiangramia sp.]|uniref:hypothetical protein n=1 Tax=Christiangramia sp. TaxID=1931228 RepID=UPI00345BF40B
MATKSGVGLFHAAIVYPTRKDLSEITKKILSMHYPITGAADHGVSEAIYLDDPDGNGIELYWNKPKEQWPRKADGSIKMYTDSLDLQDLLDLA